MSNTYHIKWICNYFKEKYSWINYKSNNEIEKHRWNKKLFIWRNKLNDLMSKKAQKNYAVLIYVQHLHVLDSVVTR